MFFVLFGDAKAGELAGHHARRLVVGVAAVVPEVRHATLTHHVLINECFAVVSFRLFFAWVIQNTKYKGQCYG